MIIVWGTQWKLHEEWFSRSKWLGPLGSFPSRSGHTGGVVTPVGSHLLILGYNSKGEPLLLCSVDPNVDTGLDFHFWRPWPSYCPNSWDGGLGMRLHQWNGSDHKDPTTHTHYSGPLVSFAPFRTPLGLHQVLD